MTTGPKYQKKPTLADTAARRGQTVAQLFAEWGVTTLDEIEARCRKEGVDPYADAPLRWLTSPQPPQPLKNALVALPQVKVDPEAGGKRRKGKVTLDDAHASDGHGRVDQGTPREPRGEA